MCGVPFHAYDLYMARLIKMGFKVAICEQMEDPKDAKKRGNKSVVKREVVRLVTPGTLTEEALLNAKRNNYIASCCVRASEIGLAWIDISTGAFFTQSLPIQQTPARTVLADALARLAPVEVLFEDRLLDAPEYFELFGEYRNQLAIRPKALYNIDSTRNIFQKAFSVQAIESMGDFSKYEIIAAGVLLEYINLTQKGHMPSLQQPVRIIGENIMEIDHATRRSLELFDTSENNDTSLIKTIDKTMTGIGARKLAERLASPSTNIDEINSRLDTVAFFLDNPGVRNEVRSILHKCQDMERAIQRLSTNRGGPKDLYDLAESLNLIPRIQAAIMNFTTHQPDSMYDKPPHDLLQLVQGFFDHSYLAQSILTALLEDKMKLPTFTRNGGFIRHSAYPPLDYLRNIRQESNLKFQNMLQLYMEETGATGLKIKDNNVIGHFIEAPTKQADKLFANNRFIHRQTVLNAVRFTTTELSEIESDINNAEEKALEMELQIFNEFVEHVMAQAITIRRSADKLAIIDVATALAELAAENNYTRPEIDDSLDFEIIEGRHPVVEDVMKKSGAGSFIGNTCALNNQTDRIWLITGPNMAGKSTFLRQNALIAILAQMGSYVPAQKAKIGVINKVFSRVGASDDLARGRSTFMVEMVETAAILNRADERSFVILDEIGRGTATFDGLSIAWSVVEHLAEINRCRTLFATHYHELTKLNKHLEGLTLHCMKIKEYDNNIHFMHSVIEGAADRSYGIHVAKLAGLPTLTIKRAEQVLKVLEEEKQNKILTAVEDELPLFSTLKKEEPEPIIITKPSAVEEELQQIDIDSLTPREALDKLYELKEKLAE